MTKPIPSVRKYMSTSPHSIGPDQPLSVAHAMMREHGIRHLPVLTGGKLAGIVTMRDLHIIETLRDVDPEKVTVEEAMTQDVYSVDPDAPLDEVCADMAERKLGSTIVMQNGHVVGVFTTVDVCRALTELLRGRLSK